MITRYNSANQNDWFDSDIRAMTMARINSSRLKTPWNVCFILSCPPRVEMPGKSRAVSAMVHWKQAIISLARIPSSQPGNPLPFVPTPVSNE